MYKYKYNDCLFDENLLFLKLSPVVADSTSNRSDRLSSTTNHVSWHVPYTHRVHLAFSIWYVYPSNTSSCPRPVTLIQYRTNVLPFPDWYPSQIIAYCAQSTDTLIVHPSNRIDTISDPDRSRVFQVNRFSLRLLSTDNLQQQVLGIRTQRTKTHCKLNEKKTLRLSISLVDFDLMMITSTYGSERSKNNILVPLKNKNHI